MKRRRPTPRRRAPDHLVDEDYRAWLRMQACCCCALPATRRKPSHAHHHTGQRGLGQKASDRHMMPLCPPCHDRLHTASGYFAGWTKPQRAYWQSQQADEHWAMYQLDRPPLNDVTQADCF